MKPSEIASAIARLYSLPWRPQRVLIEKPTQHELIHQEIQRQGIRYDVVINVQFVPIDNSRGAKFKRIKALEPLIENKQLRFVNTGWQS